MKIIVIKLNKLVVLIIMEQVQLEHQVKEIVAEMDLSHLV
jgi:hypothetical protein